jgi:RES domain-containing protein
VSNGMRAGHDPLIAHGEWDNIRQALSRCAVLAEPYKGRIHRIASKEWAIPRHFLSGQGSRKTGARWTPRAASESSIVPADLAIRLLVQSFPTVYTSVDAQTAFLELHHYATRDFFPGIPLERRFWAEFVLGEVDASLEKVVDLRKKPVLDQLQVEFTQITAEWEVEQRKGREAYTQAVGRAAHLAGIEGILFPSARAPGDALNLAVFPENCLNRDLGTRLVTRNTRPIPSRFWRHL